MPFDQKDLLKSQMVGLAMKCPFDGANPCACPLHEIRKQSLTERFAWVQTLTEAEALNIVTVHNACLLDKETTGNEESGGLSPEVQSEPLSECENV
jgi:hypothetical protein